MKSALLWALWMSVNPAGEVPSVAAYFTTFEECQRVQKVLHGQAQWSQCIEASYVVQPEITTSPLAAK